MPVINVSIQHTSTEKKKALIEGLTAEAAKVTGIDASRFIVFVEESPAENIGVGGVTLTEILAARERG